MVQTKKEDVRQSILAAARELIEKKGYHGASMVQIAKAAGMSPANIYVYFSSKLDVLFAIYDPWLRARLIQLQKDVKSIPDRSERLRFILRTLWNDIPSEENCFANNLMQALSTATPSDEYSRDLLHWSERKISEMISDALPDDRKYLMADRSLTHVVFMAFDGFAMNHKLNGPSKRIDQSLDLMVELLTGHQKA
ncbi:MAG: TetR/AcrR family transcriptional regulator [Alphaproteobacteria bacterium]